MFCDSVNTDEGTKEFISFRYSIHYTNTFGGTFEEALSFAETLFSSTLRTYNITGVSNVICISDDPVDEISQDHFCSNDSDTDCIIVDSSMAVYVRKQDNETNIYLSLSKELIKDFMSEGLYLKDMKKRFNVTKLVFDPLVAEFTDDDNIFLWVIIFFSIFMFLFLLFLLLFKRRQITTKEFQEDNDGETSNLGYEEKTADRLDDEDKRAYVLPDYEDCFEEAPDIEPDFSTSTIDVHKCSSSSCPICRRDNHATFVDVGQAKAPKNVLPSKWWEM